MSRICGQDTQPEQLVRSALHRRDLPGRPDLVQPDHSTVVFVHGCFWHRHEGCRCAYTPKSRVSFWSAKLERNVERDRRNTRGLRSGHYLRSAYHHHSMELSENSLAGCRFTE